MLVLPKMQNIRGGLVLAGSTGLAFRTGSEIVFAPLNLMKEVAIVKETGPTKGPLPAVQVSNPNGLMTIGLEANAIVYDASRDQLYAALGSTAPKLANTITALDAKTGQVVWSLNAGSDPKTLALSGDGKLLWVGLDGAGAIQRVDLSKPAISSLIPLDQGFAEKIIVMPGTNDLIAVVTTDKAGGTRIGGVYLYSDGLALPNQAKARVRRIAVGTEPGVVYGYNDESTGFELFRLLTDETGFREAQQLKRSIDGFRVDIVVAGDRIYSSNGAVVEAATGQLVGTNKAEGSVAVAVNPAANAAYYLLAKQHRLEAYTTDTFVRSAFLDLPKATEVRGSLVLVGDSALAFCAKKQIVVAPLKLLKAGAPGGKDAKSKLLTSAALEWRTPWVIWERWVRVENSAL